ncbi:hydrolase [Endozoicomonas sp. OPT23]|nr:hydrolase [Endozoicomonas sp. OPT23]
MKRLTLILVVTILFITACGTLMNKQSTDNKQLTSSPQYSETKDKFDNASPRTNKVGLFAASKEYYFNKNSESVPITDIPVTPLLAEDFKPDPSAPFKFVRLGHSSLMIQLNGKNWLLDPVFSQRVSPVQWAGPKRFHEPPISLDELPEIEGVVISHNHYDHLDHGSIRKLKDKVNHFLVPLGLSSTLTSWGVEPEKVTELDWWDSIKLSGIEFTATPSQHFSGRGLFDTDKTLWSSWAIKNDTTALFFSGDSGYFDGFKTIGEKLGPFDYSFMECGAYNKLWADVHMMPEESIQAFKDVKGKVMVPIHNGTFDLSTHAWFEPLERIQSLAEKDNIELLTPEMGQIVQQGKKQISKPWWQALIAE